MLQLTHDATCYCVKGVKPTLLWYSEVIGALPFLLCVPTSVLDWWKTVGSVCAAVCRSKHIELASMQTLMVLRGGSQQVGRRLQAAADDCVGLVIASDASGRFRFDMFQYGSFKSSRCRCSAH